MATERTTTRFFDGARSLIPGTRGPTTGGVAAPGAPAPVYRGRSPFWRYFPCRLLTALLLLIGLVFLAIALWSDNWATALFRERDPDGTIDEVRVRIGLLNTLIYPRESGKGLKFKYPNQYGYGKAGAAVYSLMLPAFVLSTVALIWLLFRLLGIAGRFTGGSVIPATLTFLAANLLLTAAIVWPAATNVSKNNPLGYGFSYWFLVTSLCILWPLALAWLIASLIRAHRYGKYERGSGLPPASTGYFGRD